MNGGCWLTMINTYVCVYKNNKDSLKVLIIQGAGN